MPKARHFQREAFARNLIFPCSCLVVLAVAASHAFVAEDAFITMRTIDNLLSGYGLRWNVDERVQSFTHPLWLFVVTPVYALTGSVGHSLASVGLLLSTVAYCVVAFPYRRNPLVLLGCVFGPWVCSHAVVKYSTSGLENSLTFLCLALFARELIREDDIRWGRLGLVFALGTLNRLDTLLLFAPAMAWAVMTNKGSVRWPRFILGCAPLALWLLFSLLYFGFPFPNTAYAKLSPDIPRQVYLLQGVRYLADLFETDPVAAALLAGCIPAVIGLALRPSTSSTVSRRMACYGLGAFAYSAYVVGIGGDFLSGRFWAAPVVVSIVVCAAALDPIMRRNAQLPRAMQIVGLVTVLTVLFGLRQATAREDAQGRMHIYSYPIARWTFVLSQLEWKPSPDVGMFAYPGHLARWKAIAKKDRVSVANIIGMSGFAAGPAVILVDPMGLADPLLARLPPLCSNVFKPGHIARAVPPGYLSARRTGSLSGMEPGLAAYYSRLRLVTAGPLTNWARLRAILGFLFGEYDHLLTTYRATIPPCPAPQHPSA